jgi:hypothetical protein
MTTTELRELDAWIDVIVFGAPKRCLHFNIKNVGGSRLECPDCHQSFGQTSLVMSRALVKNYTIDPVASRELEKKCAENNSIHINKGSTGWWVSDLDKKRNYAIAETLELAIALFARKLFAQDQ